MSENSPNTGPTPQSGKGSEERSGDGRGRRNRGPKGNQNKFRGKVEELSEYVYDISGVRDGADDFYRTTREIGEYIARTYKNGGEFRRAFDPTVLAFDTLTPPSDPADRTDLMQIEIWKLSIRDHREKVKTRDELEKQAYALVLGQCSPTVRSRLEASPKWSSTDAASDVIALLKMIRSSLYSGATSRQAMHGMLEAQKRFVTIQQTSRMSNAKYLELFQNTLAAYEHLGGDLGISKDMMQPYVEASNAYAITEDEWKAAAVRARDEYLGIRFLLGSDPNRYASLTAEVENSFTRGTSSYPSSLTKAYDMLVNYVDPSKKRSSEDRNQQGMSFLQDTGNDSERSGRGGGRGRGGRGRNQGRGSNQQAPSVAATQSENSTNHNDTSATETPYIMLHCSPQLQTTFAQRYANIPSTWILADSCSSVDIISSHELLHDIHDAKFPLTLHCNAGAVTISQQGYLGDYPEPVWYHPSGIANILSLNNLTRHYRVTMDSQDGNALRLHQADGSTIEFHPSATGLYHTAPDNLEQARGMWTLINTVQQQAAKYTRREIRDATMARQMQNIIMHPSDNQLSTTAIHHLHGCPVTQRSVAIATDVFGPNLGSLKGKTVHRPSPHVRSGIDPVPPDIIARHRNVTLAIDIMYVNALPFFITTSRNIRFVTVADLPNRQAPTIEKELKRVLQLYTHRGFNVTTVLCDPEFECLRPTFPYLNTCGADEHVPEVERMIRTIKERVRSVYATLPFRHLPRLMIKRLVANAVLWWNALPTPNGISTVYSPRYLLVGNDLTYDKHVRLEFGSYVQTHEEHSNDLRHRTLGAICLGPTGNAQGGHFFMSLTSGDRIIRHRWTSLPMPRDAITRVSQIGRQQRMPSTLTFSNRHGQEIADRLADYIDDGHPDASDDDSTYHDDHYSSGDDMDSDGYDSSDDPEESVTSSSNDDDPLDDDDDDMPDGNDAHGTRDAAPHSPTQEQLHDRRPDADDDSSSESVPIDDHSDASPVTPTRPNQNNPTAVTPGLPFASPGSTGVATTEPQRTARALTLNPTGSSFDSSASLSDESTGVGEHDDEITGVETNSAETPGVGEDDNDDRQEIEDPPLNNDEQSTSSEENNDTLWHQFQRAQNQGREAAQQNRNNGPTLRSHGNRDGHVFLTALLDAFDPNTHEPLFTLVTAQMTANKGVRVFGEAGEKAIEKELQQLLTLSVMHGVQAHQLTPDQRRAALRYLMFLKEKRCGTIKGRGCADGRKQRIYKTKDETSSPTLSNEALFLSCLIDAFEKRYTLTCDIPGAFMQAEMDEILHIKLDGAILEVLLRMDPSYQQFVTYENNKKVAYAQLDKALYGALQSALLFWKRLTAFVVDELGFSINPYDSCVANKTINGKQCTIAWYVDDLKISHKDSTVVETIFQKLQDEFGKNAPLSVTRGKIHNYLGMVIDFSVDEKVCFTMPTLVKDIISQLPLHLVTGPSTTPAANHLFEVKEGATKLTVNEADLFHRLTAQLLYLCKRARPDLQTAVAFLTTRVSSPDVDDMKKLGRCIRYLRRTAHYPLILEASCIRNIKWWVDASYAVHPDMRSHTGATMTLGKGSVYSMSTRQKMNTRSSTEAELVGVNDAMALILWTRHFLEAQGYTVDKNVVYQDNESAILLEKNGRRSSTKRTRHLEIRYFFVTDNVERKKMTIEYCPTGDMIADYFTKPLQGSPFRKLLKKILNISDDIIDSSPQECVGEHNDGESRTIPAGTSPMDHTDTSACDTRKEHSLCGPELAKVRTYADVVRSKREKGSTLSKLTFSRKPRL